MTYQEKIAKAEECYQMLLEGSKLETIYSKLSEEGYYPYDINKIMPTVRTLLEDKFSKELDKSLMSGTDIFSQRFGLADDTYEYLKEARIQSLKSYITEEIHRFVSAKLSDEEIIERVSSPLYTNQEIIDKIQKSKTSFHQVTKEEVKKNDNGKTSLIIGSIVTVAFLFFGRLSLWGVGLLIYGAYKYFGQESSKPTSIEIDDIGKE